MRICAFRASFNSIHWRKSCNNSYTTRISLLSRKYFVIYARYVMRWIFSLVEIFGYKMAFWRCYNLIHYLCSTYIATTTATATYTFMHIYTRAHESIEYIVSETVPLHAYAIRYTGYINIIRVCSYSLDRM